MHSNFCRFVYIFCLSACLFMCLHLTCLRFHSCTCVCRATWREVEGGQQRMTTKTSSSLARHSPPCPWPLVGLYRDKYMHTVVYKKVKPSRSVKSALDQLVSAAAYTVAYGSIRWLVGWSEARATVVPGMQCISAATQTVGESESPRVFACVCCRSFHLRV